MLYKSERLHYYISGRNHKLWHIIFLMQCYISFLYSFNEQFISLCRFLFCHVIESHYHRTCQLSLEMEIQSVRWEITKQCRDMPTAEAAVWPHAITTNKRNIMMFKIASVSKVVIQDTEWMNPSAIIEVKREGSIGHSKSISMLSFVPWW